MFETNDTGRLHLLCGPGEYLWSFVGTHIKLPWFHLTCFISDETSGGFTQTFMISDVKQLLEFSQRENVKLKFIDLVSPDYINGSDRWKMEPLRKILCRAGEASHSWRNYIFVLENGMQYTISGALQGNESCAHQIIFQI
jgi:hypothetical protein